MRHFIRIIAIKDNYIASIAVLLAFVCCLFYLSSCRNSSSGKHEANAKQFKEVYYTTPNIGEGVNEVAGVILHHTAVPTINDALGILCSPFTEVSCHALIDTDGTRYILAKPTDITWHAGYSRLHDREKCNQFTIGIEFQGDTTIEPLTESQINSAIEYLLPIISEYNIPIDNIATHEYVRQEWNKVHNDSVPDKCDIANSEYVRFMGILNEKLR